MPEEVSFNVIAHIKNGFCDKFGIPRQSGLVESVRSDIIFEPEYRNPDALRGIDGYSHLWLLWQFSKSERKPMQATVRPPRLGGNKRMGVFATRSPFRPNPVGLSCVKLESVEMSTSCGPILHVLGADLLDGTPIFDIKPYLAYTDSHPEAASGFALLPNCRELEVYIPPELLCLVPQSERCALIGLLSQDPRPGYQNEPERVYKMSFCALNIAFTVSGGVLTVCNIEPLI